MSAIHDEFRESAPEPDPFEPEEKSPSETNKPFLILLVVIGIGMFGFAFANVPLFQMVCGALGFGLNPNNESVAAGTGVSERTTEVLFMGNVADKLPIAFKPLDSLKTVRLGEEALVDYQFINLSDEPVYFKAVHTIRPTKADPHIGLSQCFCFDHQMLQPKQVANLPVVFRISPELGEDVHNLTFNYTLFKLDPSEYNPQGDVKKQGYLNDETNEGGTP
ncbi:MAG: cytochrome c oxidase assembly protein [Sumerlaeia bacterium]